METSGYSDCKKECLCTLIQSLKENESLETLDLSGCQSMLSRGVFPTIMDILLVNVSLREINLGPGAAVWSDSMDMAMKEQLLKNAHCRESCLRKLTMAKAQAARVFLCGYPYAGMHHESDLILWPNKCFTLFCRIHRHKVQLPLCQKLFFSKLYSSMTSSKQHTM